jgi:molybdopterin-biosynthesis enzyme MoeA-like protein
VLLTNSSFPSYDAENEYYLPQNGTLISTNSSFLQSYITNSQTTNYLFIPGDLDVATEVFNNYICQFIKQNNTIHYKTTTIKTFGIGEKDIYAILSDLIKNKYKILFLTYPDNLEVSIVIRYNENLDPIIVNDFIVKTYERLNKYIYADEETSLIKRAYDLLEVGNKKLAIAETITGGNISASFLFLG